MEVSLELKNKKKFEPTSMALPAASASSITLDDVSVDMLYRYSRADADWGNVISLATVFSQGTFTFGSLSGYQYLSAGVKVGIAVANNAPMPVTYDLILVTSGKAVITKQLTIGAHAATAAFLDQLLDSSPTVFQLIQAYIKSPQPLSATGLLFEGQTFTSIPITIYETGVPAPAASQ